MNSTVSDLIILVCEFSACCFLFNLSTQLKNHDFAKPACGPASLLSRALSASGAMSDLIVLTCDFSATPDAPGSPKVDDVDESSVTLMWTKPKNDGGKKIQGYFIEYKEVSANRWKTYNDAPLKDTMATGENATCAKCFGVLDRFSCFWPRALATGLVLIAKKFSFPETGAPKSEIPLGCCGNPESLLFDLYNKNRCFLSLHLKKKKSVRFTLFKIFQI